MGSVLGFLKEKIWFFLSFIISKGVVFIAPLFVAELLSKEDFGVLEYALAGLGMVLNTFINLGIPSAFPYFKLRESKIDLSNAFVLHYIWLLLFFILVQIGYYIIDFPIHIYMALNIAFVVSNQVYISTQLKTKEKISYAVFFDSGIYIMLLLFGLLAYFKILKPEVNTFNYIVLGYAGLYIIYTLKKLIGLNTDNIISNYKKLLKYSVHVLLGGLLIYFITVSGRILIEFFLKDFEMVGIYAYYFRLSAVVVMIHQVINIAFFKKMYLLDPKILDKYFSICFFILYIISVSVFLTTPLILPKFSVFFSTTFENYRITYFLLSTQMIFWIATALLSNIIDREKLAPKNNPLFLFLFLFFIICLFVFKQLLTLQLFTLIHLIVILCAAMIQIYTLNNKKILFRKSLWTLIFIFMLSMFGVLLFN